ncbi:GNAT family N-acetyltransferase [Salinigranum salinum]|uniref:GNAT family N-acetyltransferase n=1 Tax=Salinigranum salinum TaxID=1364937 RepID=UPI00126126EA|nr:GNAT family N-acetyltransferase [Salinigranum salinum]
MDITDKLSFSHKDRKDLYDYVESHGTVRKDEARRSLNMEPGAFGVHMTILRREGYIREVGDRLQIAYQEEAPREYESGGLSFVIRTAREDDQEDLTRTIREVAEEGDYFEAETVADVLDHEEVLIRHNEVRSRIFFVACVGDDDEVAGWVHLDLPETEFLAHTAVLTVGLRDEYRGHGIGSDLLERGVEWAREHGFEKLYNSVPETNQRAIDFLEGHGWETEAVRKHHYRIDGEYVDEVMMAVDLSD